MSALAAEAVRVDRGRTVLDDVSLEVEPGELVALIGPNGAGKSTLLHAMAGTVALAGGRITLAGDDIRKLSAVEQARRRAVLPQEHSVGFGFTCREVVAMGRHPWRRTPRRAEDADAVADAMKACDVDAFADRPFTSLSGGERARVALARVLAQRTGLLLLDEPTAAMDLHHQEAMMGLVRDQIRARAAAVVVVHDLTLAAAYSDRVAVLSAGRLRAVGPVAETLTSPLLSEVYGLPIDVADLDGRHVILPTRSS
jgi:iron complex transport system ATP-binding protein